MLVGSLAQSHCESIEKRLFKSALSEIIPMGPFQSHGEPWFS